MAGSKTRIKAGEALAKLAGVKTTFKNKTNQLRKYNTKLENGEPLTARELTKAESLLGSLEDMQKRNNVDLDMSEFMSMKQMRNTSAKNRLLSRKGTKSEAEMKSSKAADTKKAAASSKKDFEGYEGEFDFSSMDPREYGAPTRDTEGVLRNYKGGMKKPKKMNMGGQMQNRFTKKDYRKGGLFR